MYSGTPQLYKQIVYYVYKIPTLQVYMTINILKLK